jgi:hypothetical protein
MTQIELIDADFGVESLLHTGTNCSQIENGNKGEWWYFFKLSQFLGHLKMPQTSFRPNFNNKTTSVANDCILNLQNLITSLRKNKVWGAKPIG